MLDAEAQERVPRRVVLDLVATPARAVVGVAHGRVPVREEAELDRLLPAQELAQRGERLHRPAGAFAGHALAERPIAREEVVVRERRRHVRHLVGLKGGLARVDACVHRADRRLSREVVKLAASW